MVPDTPINFANDPAITNEARISMTWSPGASNGGTAILEYRVYYAEESELEDSLLVDGLTATSYTTSIDLVSGANYKLKVQARNTVGWSPLTSELVIRAARVPDDVTSVASVNDVQEGGVIIRWVAPFYDGGSPITTYTVMVLASDGVNYYQDLVNCPGNSVETLTNEECLIPYSSLDSAPFSLAYNTNVIAKVAAVNLVGEGSFVGTSATSLMVREPDTPINFQEDRPNSSKE